jgi:5-aminopentanamidase
MMNPKQLIVGAWQGVSKDCDVDANAARAAGAIDEAADAGCAFLCLPETFLTGAGAVAEVKAAAIPLTDPRIAALARHAAKRKVIAIVGLTEKHPRIPRPRMRPRMGGRAIWGRGWGYSTTQIILDGGRIAGRYVKTMPTGFDWEVMQYHDDELPIFRMRGLTFGVIVCHDSSFPEVAATLAWKGARVIFSPHFNNLPRPRMNAHRILVRNNHVGLAAHYNVVVVRANVVGQWPKGDLLGYGDSAIFGPDGAPLAEAGLFTEKLITADVAPYVSGENPWRQRTEMRRAIVDQLHAAARRALRP